MNVKFSFEKAIVERRGFTLEDVYRTIKNLFTAHDFPCVSEGISPDPNVACGR